MGRFGKILATGLLAASIVLGTTSGVSLVRADNQVRRDPNYATAVELQKASSTLVKSVQELRGQESESGSAEMKVLPGTGEQVFPAPSNKNYSYVPSSTSGQEEKLPDIEKARKDIKKAVEYLHSIRREVDSEGKIQDELREVDKSLAKDYSEKSGYSRQEKELSHVASSLVKKEGQYIQRAYENCGTRLKYGVGILGIMASLAGGAGALVKLADEYRKKDKKQNLEGKIVNTAAIISAAGLVAGLFFLSSNLTGNAIAELSNKSSSWVGAVLLAIGLGGGLLWMKARRKRGKR